jgi:hypothetical protein
MAEIGFTQLHQQSQTASKSCEMQAQLSLSLATLLAFEFNWHNSPQDLANSHPPQAI